MRMRSHRDEPHDYTNPASESIDESLARLARQDKNLNPAEQPGSRVRALGPSRAARDRVWTVIRWIVILAVAWVVWRLFQNSGSSS
jgi:hypothetical protein